MRDVLFEVGFYRLSFDTWIREQRGIIEPGLAAYREDYKRHRGVDPSREDLGRREDLIRRSQGLTRPWEYNEVVGWVRLVWDGPGPVVKGYAWPIERQRVSRRSPRIFKWGDKVLEVWFMTESSEEVAATLRADLLALTKPGERFARRHADLEAFDNVAPAVDWRHFLGLDPPG